MAVKWGAESGEIRFIAFIVDIVHKLLYNSTQYCGSGYENLCQDGIRLHRHAGTGVPIRVGRAGPHSADCRAARRAAAVSGANSAATEGGRAGGQRAGRRRRISTPEAAPGNLAWHTSWRSSTVRRRKAAQTSSASPDSPAVRVLMQAWKDVAAVERKMLDEITLADLLERAKDRRADVPHLEG